MTGWLLDTNVLSELRRPKPDAHVVDFVAGQSLDLLHVSVVTFAEIRFGIELVKDPGRRNHRGHHADMAAVGRGAGRVPQPVIEVMEVLSAFAQIYPEVRRRGRTV